MGSWLFGGGSSTKPVIYTGIQQQTSSLNLPVMIGYGRNRISFNLIWYNNFQKHAQSAKGKGKGGKGGFYTYSAAVILALGEGIITSIPAVYTGTNTVTTLANMNLTLFTGTSVQSPWGFVLSKYPDEALSYANTAYLANENMDLGASATLPSMAFEAIMHLSGSMPGTDDVNIADVIKDYLTNTQYRIGLTTSMLDEVSRLYFQSYNQAQGIFMSPVLYQQEKITNTIDRWAQLGNAFIFYSGTAIKFVPLGDESLSANDTTYEPTKTIQYDLTVSAFVDQSVPIKVTRIDPADSYNRTRVTISDRSNQYNSNPIEYRSQTLIDLYGFRDNTDIQGAEICEATIGLICATLIGKRVAYLRNTYSFRLLTRYIRLEPGDIVTITCPVVAAINKLPVRILTTKLNKDGIDISAEEYPGILGIFSPPNKQEVIQNNPLNIFVDPGDVNTPAIVEPNSEFDGTACILVSASGGPNWGGANSYISFDLGTTYVPSGTISSPGVQGVLTAPLASHVDPDTADTLSVDMTESQSEPEPVSHDDADTFRTLSLIAPQPIAGVIPQGELTSFGDVSPTGTYSADLSYLRRGVYGSPIGSHSTGDQFTVFDISLAAGTTLRVPLPISYIGGPIFIKFTSFNIFEKATQDISTVVAYQYTPNGTGYGGGLGGVPLTPTGFAAVGGVGQISFSWDANANTDNVTKYTLYEAAGAGGSFGAASPVWSGNSTSTTLTGLSSGVNTYFLTASNVVGESLPTSGLDADIGSPLSSGSSGFGFNVGGLMLDNEDLGMCVFSQDMVFTDSDPLSIVECIMPAAADATMNIYRVTSISTTLIGTIFFAAGSFTGTVAWLSSPYTLSTGSRLNLRAPTPADINLAFVTGQVHGSPI